MAVLFEAANSKVGVFRKSALVPARPPRSCDGTVSAAANDRAIACAALDPAAGRTDAEVERFACVDVVSALARSPSLPDPPGETVGLGSRACLVALPKSGGDGGDDEAHGPTSVESVSGVSSDSGELFEPSPPRPRPFCLATFLPSASSSLVPCCCSA